MPLGVGLAKRCEEVGTKVDNSSPAKDNLFIVAARRDAEDDMT